MTAPADEINAPMGTPGRARQSVEELLSRDDWRALDADTWVCAVELDRSRWAIWRRATDDRRYAIRSVETYPTADAAALVWGTK